MQQVLAAYLRDQISASQRALDALNLGARVMQPKEQQLAILAWMEGRGGTVEKSDLYRKAADVGVGRQGLGGYSLGPRGGPHRWIEAEARFRLLTDAGRAHLANLRKELGRDS